MVKLRKEDELRLERLAQEIMKVKGKESKSKVLGLSLKFAQENLNEFLATVLGDLEGEPMLRVLRTPAVGQKTDARKVKEYLYGQ